MGWLDDFAIEKLGFYTSSTYESKSTLLPNFWELVLVFLEMADF